MKYINPNILGINIILLFFLLKFVYSFNATEILSNPNNYRYVLCSGNGEPFYNSTTNQVTCTCKEGYTNEPSEKNKQYLYGHFVQCSYRRKSRFVALFLALCLPFGFDFYYLGKWVIFIAIFCVCVCVITLNIFMFIINYQIKMKNKESKNKKKVDKMRSTSNKNEEMKKEKCIRILNIIASILLFNHILYMIIVIILHLTGVIKDSYGISTENDLGYLFEKASDD